jgi:hypothetical protein
MIIKHYHKAALLIIIGCSSYLSTNLSKEVIPKLADITEQKVEYDRVCFTKNMKITQYYLPRVFGLCYSKDNYDCAFMVGKIKVFFKSEDYRKLKVEGFIQVNYETPNGVEHTVYIDHNKNVHPYPLDRRGKKLEPGDVACNSLTYGTEVIINGKKYTVKDCGGGLDNDQIDIYTEYYSKKTEHNVIVTIYPPAKQKA